MNNLQGIISRATNNAAVQMEKLGVISGASANYTTDAYKTPRFDTFVLADGRVAGVERYDYSQGSICRTNQELDVAIDGPGFVPVTTKDGKVAYTRNLSMKTTNEGLLVMGDGSVIGGGIKVPIDSKKIQITPQGKVLSYDDKHLEGIEIGQIPLVKFNNYEGLEQGDFNKVYETEESGKPILVSNHTSFTQYNLERSNFNMYDSVNETLRLNASLTASTSIIKFTNQIYQQAINLEQ
ncbi:MAG: hypothetical protein MJ180_02390 [Candidatus Gastranaerophilales bacterium]|nr:hypothetical protein [Candidatus Gastranaerophilales bacterium]